MMLVAFIDIVILIIVVSIIGFVVYFNFIKREKGKCSGCSHKKKCTALKQNMSECIADYKRDNQQQ